MWGAYKAEEDESFETRNREAHDSIDAPAHDVFQAHSTKILKLEFL